MRPCNNNIILDGIKGNNLILFQGEEPRAVQTRWDASSTPYLTVLDGCNHNQCRLSSACLLNVTRLSQPSSSARRLFSRSSCFVPLPASSLGFTLSAGLRPESAELKDDGACTMKYLPFRDRFEPRSCAIRTILAWSRQCLSGL